MKTQHSHTHTHTHTRHIEEKGEAQIILLLSVTSHLSLFQKPKPTQHTLPQALSYLPNDAEELGHGQFLWDQELGLVQPGQELLPGVTLHYHLSRISTWISSEANVKGYTSLFYIWGTWTRKKEVIGWVLVFQRIGSHSPPSPNPCPHPHSHSPGQWSYRDLARELHSDSSNFLSSGCCEHLRLNEHISIYRSLYLASLSQGPKPRQLFWELYLSSSSAWKVWGLGFSVESAFCSTVVSLSAWKKKKNLTTRT